jgi:hypothetical protein
VVWYGVQRLQADPVVLQNYNVPPEIAGEVNSSLARALDGGLGRVTMMPNGRLVVSARSSVQKGVADVIRDVTQNKPGPTPTIGFDVWVVTATPGNGATSEGLTEIEPALAAIRKNKGAQNFELRDKLSTLLQSGQQPGRAKSGLSQMEIRASLRKGADNQPTVAARFDIDILRSDLIGVSLASLNAQSELRPGELLVLGQSALASPSPPGTPQTNKQVYYIVRATL